MAAGHDRVSLKARVNACIPTLSNFRPDGMSWSGSRRAQVLSPAAPTAVW
jgi:hypothetical protein